MVNWTSSSYIKPMRIAEHEFLQVLISDFTINRTVQGNHLEVKFDENNFALWSGKGKSAVLNRIPDFQHKSLQYQQELDEFLLERKGKKTYEFSDTDFLFRYASGGSLPIVKIENTEYYALFYRQIFPIGWNIANGSCDNRHELLNPLQAVDRELCEELLVAAPKARRRYVFSEDKTKPLDHPDFAVARQFWQERGVELSQFEPLTIPIKWLEGPDSVEIKFNDSDNRVTGCFLNINALDFGIEVDRIAIMNLSGEPEVVLCDGELFGSQLVNSPIGLFKVDMLNQQLLEGFTEFKPDRLFFDGQQRDVEEMEKVAAEWLKEKLKKGIMNRKQAKEYASERFPYQLCPVTGRIIKRYSQIRRLPSTGKEGYDCFICYGGEDGHFANMINSHIQEKGKKAFFSKESIDVNYYHAVNKALESAKCLIAVASNPDNLRREWPEYEYGVFHNLILQRQKPRPPESKLLSCIKGFEAVQLPMPLNHFQAVEFDRHTKPLSVLDKYIEGC